MAEVGLKLVRGWAIQTRARTIDSTSIFSGARMELRSKLSGETDVHLLLVGLDHGDAVEDLLGGVHDSLAHDGLLDGLAS